MTRRELRENVVRLLYLSGFYAEKTEIDEQISLYLGRIEATDKDVEFITNRVNNVLENVEKIDEELTQSSTGWKTDRMSKIDLNILRLAIYEMNYDEDIPEKVAIDEAVELAKIYGGENSPSFVNGILAKIITKNE